MKENFEKKLLKMIDKEKILFDEPMKKHTTFRIGGPADYFIVPTEIEEIRAVVSLCEEMGMPYYVIGNGSNLLVADKGFRGVILQIYKAMNQVKIEGNVITAQAGASLAQIAKEALEHALTGFEFAAGIPGTLGGAVRMNAGAYGGEIKDILTKATVLTKEGEVVELSKEELEFGYRTSIIERTGQIVLKAEIELSPGKREEIKAVMDDLRKKRVSKQPLEFPSAGSTFKRPEGHFAGKLIQDAGLKGFCIGGAQVSEKHSGFVINTGNATASDVVELMRQVNEKVTDMFGVSLEPEVRRIGEF
ncbi:MAG: UDP-N-acetylmuramate dehydrogenase [bacterium]|nr:UDP-N-acetylmuramate dehydrogenase [bacterium]